jgi:transcriptional regulator GlxA family with amidase domain
MESLHELLAAADRWVSCGGGADRSRAASVLRVLREELAQRGAASPLVAPLAVALRLYMAMAPATLHEFKVGEARIWKAIALMQDELAKRWTVKKLAKASGMSRAVFAREFALATGLSPLRYLARCRMELAATLLGDSNRRLAEIAREVGYDSEYAFSRAFKRHHHVAPGVFRRQIVTVGVAPIRAAA